jgi:hypothetical protein
MKETKGGARPSHSPKQKSSLFSAHKGYFKFLKRVLIAFARRRRLSAGGTINLLRGTDAGRSIYNTF